MKNLVKTTGTFMLRDPQTNDEVSAFRPSVVSATQFIAARISSGQLTLLTAKLPDEATDKEFAEFWAECVNKHDNDPELAMQSFLANIERYQPQDEVDAERRAKLEESDRLAAEEDRRVLEAEQAEKDRLEEVARAQAEQAEKDRLAAEAAATTTTSATKPAAAKAK